MLLRLIHLLTHCEYLPDHDTFKQVPCSSSIRYLFDFLLDRSLGPSDSLHCSENLPDCVPTEESIALGIDIVLFNLGN